MPVEKMPRTTRKRSASLGSFRSPVKEVGSLPLPNAHLIDLPSTRKTRSRSMDVTPRLMRRESSNRSQSYRLRIVFNTVSKDVVFSGSSLDELKATINGCYLYLPVVKVCIEHPSMPHTLVNITDIDQLYDNAVIVLVPSSPLSSNKQWMWLFFQHIKWQMCSAH
ncbi:hypothetical protein WA577_001234 [Blastocystis sp. JDR]